MYKPPTNQGEHEDMKWENTWARKALNKLFKVKSFPKLGQKDNLTPYNQPRLTFACAYQGGLLYAGPVDLSTIVMATIDPSGDDAEKLRRKSENVDVLRALVTVVKAGHDVLFLSAVPSQFLADNYEDEHLEAALERAGIDKEDWRQMQPGRFINVQSIKKTDLPPIDIFIDKRDHSDWDKKGRVRLRINPRSQEAGSFFDAIHKNPYQDIAALAFAVFSGSGTKTGYEKEGPR